MENPNPVILDRFPETDYDDIPFTENAEFVQFDSIVLCTSFVFLREQELNIEKWKSEIPTFLLFALLNREKIESNQDIEMDRRVMGQV